MHLGTRFEYVHFSLVLLVRLCMNIHSCLTIEAHLKSASHFQTYKVKESAFLLVVRKAYDSHF